MFLPSTPSPYATLHTIHPSIVARTRGFPITVAMQLKQRQKKSKHMPASVVQERLESQVLPQPHDRE